MKKAQLVIAFLCISFHFYAQIDFKEAVNNCKGLGFFESQECLIGQEIPQFEGITLEGKTINNETIEDKIVVFHFWFTSCPPCIAELDGLNEIVEFYKEREEIEFISFTTETINSLDEYFFPNWELNFEIVPDARDLILDTFHSWYGFPTTIVVNKKGQIHKIFSGGLTDPKEANEEIKAKLIPLINQCSQ